MQVRDAAARVERELRDTKHFQTVYGMAASSRYIDPAVDLGILPEGLERWSVTGFYRVPSMAAMITDLVLAKLPVPTLADLPYPAPSWDEVQRLGGVYARAMGALVTEVAATAPRREGGPWYHVDLSAPLSDAAVPLLKAAREAVMPFMLAKVARIAEDEQ